MTKIYQVGKDIYYCINEYKEAKDFSRIQNNERGNGILKGGKANQKIHDGHRPYLEGNGEDSMPSQPKIPIPSTVVGVPITRYYHKKRSSWSRGC